jgi:hypothetical protein
MKKAVKAGNLCLLVLGMTLALTIAAAPATHADVTDVEFYIDPSLNAYSSSTPLHTKFNVTIMWNDTGTPLNTVFAWQVSLNYNSTLLNCTKAWQPNWDSDYIFYGMASVMPSAAYSDGNTAIMDTLSGLGVSGSGALKKLAIFQMDIIYIPPDGVAASSVLGITNQETIWSPDGFDYPVPAQIDGTYTIPELSLAVMMLALFATSTTAIVLHKKRTS